MAHGITPHRSIGKPGDAERARFDLGQAQCVLVGDLTAIRGVARRQVVAVQQPHLVVQVVERRCKLRQQPQLRLLLQNQSCMYHCCLDLSCGREIS